MDNVSSGPEGWAVTVEQGDILISLISDVLAGIGGLRTIALLLVSLLILGQWLRGFRR